LTQQTISILKIAGTKGKIMITTITWTTFWIAATALLTFYYLIFGIYFYSGALKNLFNKSQEPDFRPLLIEEDEQEKVADIALTNAELRESQLNNPIDKRVESIIEQLKDGIATASENREQPKAFKAYLANILKEFPDIRNSDFQPAINEFIVKECKIYGSIAISEDETEQLW
jgi:hypothetical protein